MGDEIARNASQGRLRCRFEVRLVKRPLSWTPLAPLDLALIWTRWTKQLSVYIALHRREPAARIGLEAARPRAGGVTPGASAHRCSSP